MKPHKVLERKHDGLNALQLTEGKYAGIIFSYGKVELKEDHEHDALHMHFEYEVHDKNGIEYEKEDFEKEIYDLLCDLIREGIEKNDITYTGGVDEDRTNDSEQSDL